MKLAIASGKGGTGKTTVATNLAFVANQAGCDVAYADCDVEEPNGHLFLKPALTGKQAVNKPTPKVDARRCNGCGECVRFCQFHAIVCLGAQALVYPELCHACGGCALVCPQEAITEVLSEIGLVEWGLADGIQFFQGILRVGEPQSPPVIRAVKAAVPPAALILFDAPPGTSCPVVETVRQTDFLLLVTEPTPFGLHDLKLAVDMAKALKVDCGVVINRALVGRPEARQLCREAGLPVLAEIPDDLGVARAYSQGKLAVEAVPGLRRLFAQLLLNLAGIARTEIFDGRVRLNLDQMTQTPSQNSSDENDGVLQERVQPPASGETGSFSTP
jgi:MinD superfamily P-loop ATPase